MSIEAMKQAADTLEIGLAYPGMRFYHDNIRAAITALRTAIEQAESVEPRCAVIVEVFGTDWRLDYMSLPVGKHKLYTQEYVYTTPLAAPAHEPDYKNLFEQMCQQHDMVVDKLKAAQRQWVGLTEKDFSAINQSCLTKLQAATSAESILKEKNT